LDIICFSTERSIPTECELMYFHIFMLRDEIDLEILKYDEIYYWDKNFIELK